MGRKSVRGFCDQAESLIFCVVGLLFTPRSQRVTTTETSSVRLFIDTEQNHHMATTFNDKQVYELMCNGTAVASTSVIYCPCP